MENNRRQFLSSSISITAAAALVSACATESVSTGSGPKIRAASLARQDVILFQGDSITDAGRDKESPAPSERRALGNGYAYLAAATLLNRYPAADLRIFNRGISGNKVYQLAERWENECIALNPAVLSILIGVNDYWHKHNKKYDGTVEIYENDYRALLKRTTVSLPAVRLVIGEPFGLRGAKSVDDTLFPEFDAYRAVARKLADEFGAIFIPYHEVFAKASQIAPPTYWAQDGVHPSFAGSALMAETWMNHVFAK